MQKLTIPVIACAIALTGCTSSPEALEKSESAVRSSKTYAENYQEVFRRLSNTAKRCQSTSGSAAFTVDAQLYSELGFGEVTMSMVSLYPRSYYWKAKVEKAGSGSRVSVVSGGGLGKGRMLNDVIRYADGDDKC